MAEYIKRIRTDAGDLQIDYNSLANLPDLAPESLGAAPTNHIHTPEEAGAAPKDHIHTPEEAGAAPAEHTHSAEEAGAISSDGGEMTGDLVFSNIVDNNGLQWLTPNGTSMNIKPDSSGNLLQITATTEDGAEEPLLSVGQNGEIILKKPLAISEGGTEANNAESARINLGITPENIGAVPKTGGTVEGSILLSKGDEWTTFQNVRTVDGVQHGIDIYVSGTGVGEFIKTTADVATNKMTLKDDETYFMRAVSVVSGGTGAATAAQALKNLGVIYSETEPTYQEGAIWLKPVE